MRLSDSDRERLLEQLKAHAVSGALDPSELERRVEIVERASDSDEARPAFADLPEPVLGAPPAPPAPTSSRPRWGRGHGEAEIAESGWLPTSERFRDPRSGTVVRVWVDSAGGRHYVPDRPA